MGKVKQTRRKLSQFFNWRVSATLLDGRVLVGTLMAVDKHVNLVLCNTEEYRKYKVKGHPEGKELKRMLGLVVARGRNVLYVQPEALQKEELVETDKPQKKAAPKAAPAAPAAAAASGPAAAKPGGLPSLPPGLLATLPGLQGLAGLRPPAGLLPPGGFPGLGGGIPGLPGMPGPPQVNPQMLAALRATMPQPGAPGMPGMPPQPNPQMLAAMKAGMPLPQMP
uniref:Sm protein B n=1 Tax=Alexandrium monilatum TaxID=311494 RepID=A0A7S4WC68_9DINO